MKLLLKSSSKHPKPDTKALKPKDVVVTALFFGLPMLVLAVVHISGSVLSARMPEDTGNRYAWFVQNVLNGVKKKSDK